MKRKRLLFIFMTEIFILVICLLLISRYENVQQILSPPITDWQSRWISYSEGWKVDPGIISNIDAEDDFDLIYGPFISISKGMYGVTVEYTCDVRQDISVYSYKNNDAIHMIGNVKLNPKNKSYSGHFFTDRDISDLEVRVKYNGEGDLRINNIYIYHTAFYFKLALALLTFIILIADGLYIKKVSVKSTDMSHFIRYRKVWMAIAIIWVMLYHSGIKTGISAINFITAHGYGGVDIFLFASGMGCYLSYFRDSDAAAFMARRIRRILPTYLVFIVPWLIYKVIVDGMPFVSVLGNLFSTEGIKGTIFAFNWYIIAMWLFYCFTPYMANLVRQYIRSWYGCFILIALSVVFSLSFWGYFDWLIIVSRTGIVFLGMYFAKMCNEKRFTFQAGDGIIYFACILAGFFLLGLSDKYFDSHIGSDAFYWYPLILIVPGVCVMLSLLMDVLSETAAGKHILKLLNSIGEITFELYLIHLAFIRLTGSLISKKILNAGIFWYAAALLLSLPAAYILRYIVRITLKVCKTDQHKPSESNNGI